MNNVQRSSFRLNPIAAAIAIAMAAPFAASVALAGSGFGAGVDLNNAPVAVPTYYANSPVGPVPALTTGGAQTINTITGLPQMIDTGKALRKFVDTLPGIPGITTFGANNLGQYIPLAVAEKWVDLNGVTTTDDYYEIAAVEFSEKMHSDLSKPTRMRGYVQLSTPTNPGKHIALHYPDGTPILAGGVQVYAYDNPHHLGPVIKSIKGTAVRVKFTNYLPAGTGGELFIPVDTTITGAGTAPDGSAYTQNRALIHLVGGQAPWISAGTPHQWVAPAADATANKKGASAQNVPDMADPGDGSTTLYFPNDMSARFMFYQDRTSGLTRLNSYAGLEAGYVVTDAAEQNLISTGAIPADQIPLIIEDKTFVPGNVAQQDAKWDTTHWGQPGDLWFPHVYEPNQDVNSINGANPVGRWDFGPLFWPIFPVNAPLPSGEYGNASFVPEAFHDTPVINGTAYPTLTLDPKAYRFRILNASNDRFINLSLFKADGSVKAPQLDLNGNPIVDANGVQQFFTNTEVKMVPAIGNAAGDPVGWDATNGVQLPLPQYDGIIKSNITGEPSGPMRAWPKDNRIGGTPDPLTTGPDFIVIGNDGGFLPAPVDIPAQPITYEANRRSITVGNIYGSALLLGPAERADAIVDFSAYAGQTLILYNDAPAPAPFNDVRNDYFTGGPDFTASGGAYSTKPGYGPNTRTMMQITVRATTPAAAYNPTVLNTALPAAYAATQPAPIVPAVAYNAAFGTKDTDIYAHVATGSAAQPNLEFSSGAITITGVSLVSSGGPGSGSGTGYDPAKPPTVVFNNTVNGVDCLPLGSTSAAAHATVDLITRQVTAVTLDNPYVPASGGNAASGGYSGYTCAPTVTFANPPGTSGVGAQAAVMSTNFSRIAVLTKAEQELFDNRGRYNSTGGVELPLTNALLQTTIPLNYIDTVTETIGDNEVQIWKLVDNGLWTNSVHFDMVDVQLINRVGWDGTLKPPASNEVGWKDTLKLNPLEDVIIAMRAKRPSTPFGMPQSQRLMDPSKPLDGAGSGLGFTNAPDLPGLAASNLSINFDNEFTWGSSILGHSENDFRRPVVFNPTVIVPDAPSNLADLLGNGTLTWIDPTPAAAATTLANPKNEIGFKIVEATSATVLNADGTTTKTWTYTPFPKPPAIQATVPANTTNWTQPLPIVAGRSFAVVAYNAAGDSAPSTPYGDVAPSWAVASTFTGTATAYNSVTLNWSGNSTNNSLEVWRDGVLIATLPGSATTYVDNTVTAVQTYNYTITARNSLGAASFGPTQVTTPMIFVAAPTTLTATPNNAGTSVTLRWTDQANNETAYLVEQSINGAAFTTLATLNRSNFQRTGTGGAVAYTTGTTPGSIYTFRITAINVTGTATSTSSPPASDVTAVVDLTAPLPSAMPTGLTATLATATRVTLTWVDAANNENAYVVTITDANTNALLNTVTLNRSAAQSTASGGNVTYNATVAAGISYNFSVVAQATRYGLTTQSTVAGPVRVDVSAPLPPTAVDAVQGPAAGQITVSWTDASNNESGFTIQRSLLNNAGTTWGAWGNAGTVAASVTTFTDTGRITGRSYRYQVRANGVVGNSVYVGASSTVVAP